MRQSRTKIKKQYQKKTIAFILIFALIMPITSIAFGYLGTKYIILDHFIHPSPLNENDKKVPFEEQHNTEEPFHKLELERLSIYSIQIASFSDKENAQKLAEEINRKGFGAYISHIQPYRVLTISALDRKTTELVMPMVQKEYPEAFIIEETIPMKNFSYNKADEKYILLFENNHKQFIDALNRVTKITSQLLLNEITTEQYQFFMNQNNQMLQSLEEEFKLVNSSGSFQNICSDFALFVDDFKKALEAGVKNDSDKKFVQLQNACVWGLYHYLDFRQKIES